MKPILLAQLVQSNKSVLTHSKGSIIKEATNKSPGLLQTRIWVSNNRIEGGNSN